MKNTYLWFILLLLSLFFDGWSTFLTTGGRLDVSNELHFVAQVFNGSFELLVLVLIVEFLFLLTAYLYSQKSTNRLKKREVPYKVLSLKPRSNIYSRVQIRVALEKVIPYVLAIFILTHGLAACNNFLVYAYNQRITRPKVVVEMVNAYVDFVYLGHRLYLVQLFTVFCILVLGIWMYWSNARKMNLKNLNEDF